MLGATDLQCQQAFNAGDMAFFNAAKCANSEYNDSLIATTKSNLSRQTYILIGIAVLSTAAIIYFSVKK